MLEHSVINLKYNIACWDNLTAGWEQILIQCKKARIKNIQ